MIEEAPTTNLPKKMPQLATNGAATREAASNGPDETDERERSAAEELDRITATNRELLELAKKLCPPASWFESEEEKPW